MILTLRVDFRFSPVEYAEGVLGSEIDEREGKGTRAGFPGWGFGEEQVADEIVVGGGGWRVDTYPVEHRR